MVTAPHHVPSERLGPIDYIVIEFPDGKVTGAGFRRIVELSDAARILVLDIEFLSKGADGHVVTTPAHDLGEIDGVEQLTRYMTDLANDPALGTLRGMFVAQSIKPQARTLAESRGFTCVEVDYDALRGKKSDDWTLFS